MIYLCALWNFITDQRLVELWVLLWKTCPPISYGRYCTLNCCVSCKHFILRTHAWQIQCQAPWLTLWSLSRSYNMVSDKFISFILFLTTKWFTWEFYNYTFIKCKYKKNWSFKKNQKKNVLSLEIFFF